MPKRSSSACSIAPGSTSRRASCRRNTPTRYGNYIRRRCGTSSTAIACMGVRPAAGHRQPEQIAWIDPYAKALVGWRWSDVVFGYRSAARARTRPRPPRQRGTCRNAGSSKPPLPELRPSAAHPWEETIIPEMNVRAYDHIRRRDARPRHLARASPAIIDALVEFRARGRVPAWHTAVMTVIPPAAACH